MTMIRISSALSQPPSSVVTMAVQAATTEELVADVERPLEALQALAAQPWVRDSALSGSRVRVRVAEGTEDAEAQLRTTLEAAGIGVEQDRARKGILSGKGPRNSASLSRYRSFQWHAFHVFTGPVFRRARRRKGRKEFLRSTTISKKSFRRSRKNAIF